MKREESMGKDNIVTGLSEILPFEKSLDFVNSEINLSSMPANLPSTSEGMPGDQTITNGLDASASEFLWMIYKPRLTTWALRPMIVQLSVLPWQGNENQEDFSFPMFLSNVVSEAYRNPKTQGRKSSEIPAERHHPIFNWRKHCESHDSCESVIFVQTSTVVPSSESQFSNFKTVYETGHQMSALFHSKVKEAYMSTFKILERWEASRARRQCQTWRKAKFVEREVIILY